MQPLIILDDIIQFKTIMYRVTYIVKHLLDGRLYDDRKNKFWHFSTKKDFSKNIQPTAQIKENYLASKVLMAKGAVVQWGQT